MATPGKDIAHLVKAALLVCLLVVLCGLVWRELPSQWLDSRWLEAWIKSMGILAPPAYILLRTVAIVLTVVPNAPLDVAGGVLFGPFWGTVYSLIGSEAGAIACFLLAHALGREAITRLLHREIAFSNGHYPQRQMAYIVLFARLEPVFSFALVSYGAGLTGMSLRAFALTTLLGMTPGTVLLNYYGKTFFTGVSLVQQIILGLALVALLLAIPVWIRHNRPDWWHERTRETGPPEGGPQP
ncbi:TVP38/TMEM64 family protein [Geobacter sp. FeAm09]|uniref:TVP38/TMEM64 family protein n=1 Tax=Geobacter sp. FeAm09 TaxID=2597769 RepID=UPI0011EC5A6C|nr:TVP38/TMEM64 family protein [Geobacter sp. FeAm09]QEM68420.1 TVP38/TMEM64 family protein [Geobacter sp. FeAm09]